MRLGIISLSILDLILTVYCACNFDRVEKLMLTALNNIISL